MDIPSFILGIVIGMIIITYINTDNDDDNFHPRFS